MAKSSRKLFRRPAKSRPVKARLWLNTLEARVTPATFTVLNTLDSGAGSLRDAITQANALAGPDVINFNAGVTGTIALATGLPTISDDVSIQGPVATNLTVSGGGLVRPFLCFVPGKFANISFSGMTIANGNANGANAGAIFCSDEIVTISDCVITGNTATVQGGAINCSSYGQLNIFNSTISNNVLNAPNGGGAIFMAGRSQLVIRNSSLTGNSANGGNGGALVMYGINTLLMENTTVSGNVSTKAATTGGLPSGGGGIFVYGTTEAPLWLFRNCTIAGNSANGNGGGILLSQAAGVAATMNILNCTITGNTASGAAGFAGGGGGISRVQGGAVFNITSSVVAENVDTGTAAPDIQSAGTVCTNSLIGDPNGFTQTGTGNLAFGTPTGLGPLTNNGGTVQTRVPLAGSALINAGSNPVSGTGVTQLLTNPNGTDARGPGFSRSVGNLPDIGAAEAGTTAGASASATAPDVTTVGGTTYTFTVTYTTPGTLDVGSLGSNDITVNGPGGFTQNAAFQSVTGNTATYTITPAGGITSALYGAYSIDVNAGAVTFNSGAGAIPTGSAGRVNFLTPNTFNVTAAVDTGAGSLRQAILDANARIFTADTIAFTPGLAGTVTVSARMTINDPVSIVGSGAGLYTLSGNNVTALIRLQGPRVLNVSISGIRFTAGNTTPNGTTGGGAIFTSNENATLDSVIIENNTSITIGGGISVGVGTTPGSLTVRNSTIAGNSATGATTNGTGGGISMPGGGRLLVENSTISGNTSATVEGGGIYLRYGSPDGVVIRNSTIANNTSSTLGGGISFKSLNAPALITNSTIAANSSGTGGNVSSATPFAPGIVTLTSSVIAFGNAGTGPDFNGAVTADHSLIKDQTGTTVTDAGGNLAAGTDPLFVGGSTPTLANNGGPTQTIALQSTSPLKNTGSNPSGLTTDQRGPGFARVGGPAADIGAFEIQFAPRVASTVVNAGTANLAQRSLVTNITVTFDTVVNFSGAVNAAFQIARVGGAAIGGFTATVAVVNGQTVVTLSGFTGAGTENGSLADGFYQVTALAAQISTAAGQLDGNGDGTGGDNFVLVGDLTNKLFRLFGDANGDGTISGGDFGLFRLAFGSVFGDPNYVYFFDFDNNNGAISGGDFGQFRIRFGTGVP